MNEIGWDDLKIFLALSRKGTIRRAAASLSVSHSTVSRRLEALEKRLGVRLFDRLPGGYALNASGERIVEHATAVEREIFNLERSVLGGDMRLSGPIRLTLLPPMVPLLMPVLADFHEAYPEIDLELLATSEVVDLARRDADVAIRFVQEPEPWLVGRRLPQFGNAAFATEEYIRAHSFQGKNATARWIGWRGDDAQPEWIAETDFPECRAFWQINDPAAQQAAAKAGLGMTLLPCWIGDRDPDLIRVPPGRVGTLRQAWILTHPDLRTSARVRATVAFLASALERLAPVLMGGDASRVPGSSFAKDRSDEVARSPREKLR